jgi:hypothetical protein
MKSGLHWLWIAAVGKLGTVYLGSADLLIRSLDCIGLVLRRGLHLAWQRDQLTKLNGYGTTLVGILFLDGLQRHLFWFHPMVCLVVST